MIQLDTEDQRVVLLQLVDGCQFSGSDVEKVYHLKKAVEGAVVRQHDASPGGRSRDD